MEITGVHREELAAFLRSRRERLSPAEAGIVDLRGRRTPGLRRAEVAARAGVSLTWYTWLEQARRIRVSDQVLASLARALLLDASETGHLFALAGEVAPAVEVSRTAPAAPPPCLGLLDRLDPLPALVINRRWDIIAANSAYATVVPFFRSLSDPQRNLLSMLFEPEARELFADWSLEASSAVAAFRARVGRQIAEPELADFLRRLGRRHPDFNTLWNRRDVAEASTSVHVIAHPQLGRIELIGLQLLTPSYDTTLVVYQPAASERDLADRIERLMAGNAPEKVAASG